MKWKTWSWEGLIHFLDFLTYLPEKTSKINIQKSYILANFRGGVGLFWSLLLKKVKKIYTKTKEFSFYIHCML